MPDRNRRTNLLLLLVMVLICTGCALLFRQSTAYPSKVEGGTVRLFASEDTEKPEADNGSSKTDVSESEEKVSPAATPTATPVPFEVSPEAEKGVWTSSGSNWMFMVDGQAYTGWLTDTDGKRYFFDSSGIMKTGWVDDGGKRYFMDLDGIMQTGFITTEGKSYELLSDGSLKGYKAAVKLLFCSDPWNRNCSASVDVSKACKNSGALSCGTEQPAEIRPCAPSDRMAWRKCKNYHRCRYVCGDFRVCDQSLYRLSGCRP